MGGVIRQVAITGRVQGVGYRAWVDHRARINDLAAWGRNRTDGRVEALFAGPEEVVSEMIASCRRGPSSARVDAIRDEPASPDALNLRYAGERFSMLPTV